MPGWAAQRMSELAVGDSGGLLQPTPLAALIAADAIDVELAALVWLLAEQGVPLVVASRDGEQARRFRSAIGALLPEDRRTADMALTGGTFVADSFQEVLRLSGALPEGPNGEVADSARDLGIVHIVRDGRVRVAHYVRPVERDGAGHLQRRPPAILSATGGEGAGPVDHYYWAFTEELATRAGMDRDEFEDEHRRRTARLAAVPAASAGEH
jgi:hypothetical protein